MSPAPQRVTRSPTGSFPHRWGYWVSGAAIVAGIVVAVVLIVSAVQGFVDDVNGLRRVAGSDNLALGLEQGEYFVFDEDGAPFGPLDVRVLRDDGLEIDTTPVDDGTTYDVDGHRGEARVSFRVPTQSIYRVEIDTSVADLTRFAVGADVGNSRTNGIIAGLAIGGVLVVAGLVGILVTAALHVRWRVRDRALAHVTRARASVSEATDPARLAEMRQAAADTGIARAKGWADEALDRGRAGVASGEHGRPPRFARSAEQAKELIEQAQAAVDQLAATSAEAATTPGVGEEAVQRVDEALARVQTRLESGDRLRDIVRDERSLVDDTVARVAALADSGGGQAGAGAAAIAAAAAAMDSMEGAATEAQQLGATGAELTQSALVDIADAAVAIGDDAVRTLHEEAMSASDELMSSAMAEFDAALAEGTKTLAESGRRLARQSEPDGAVPTAGDAVAPGSGSGEPPGGSDRAVQPRAAGSSVDARPAPALAPPPRGRQLRRTPDAAGARSGFAALAPPPVTGGAVSTAPPPHAAVGIAPPPPVRALDTSTPRHRGSGGEDPPADLAKAADGP